MFFVYRITGPTGAYIGKSNNPEKRWKAHKECSKREDSRFYRALRRHGFNQFRLEVVASAQTEADSFACEALIIAQERAQGTRLYNISEGGVGNSGKPNLSSATRLKLSLATKGKPKSPEHRAKIAAAHRGMSPDAVTRQKLSDIAKARWAALPLSVRRSRMQYVRGEAA